MSHLDAFVAAEFSLVLGFISFKYIEKLFLESRFFLTFGYLILMLTATLSMTSVNVGYVGDNVNVKELNFSLTVSDVVLLELTVKLLEKACYEFSSVPYLPANVTSSMREKAMQINKDMRAEKLPVLKNMYHLKDLMYEKHFTQSKLSINYHDYFEGNGTLTVVVMGNSYAHSGFPSVINAFGEYIKEIHLLSNSACQPFLNLAKYAPGSYRNFCPKFVKCSLALIDDLKPDIVFFIFKPAFGTLRKITNITTDQVTADMQETINRVSKSTKAVLIQMPLPSSDKSYTDLMLKVLEKKQSFDGLYITFSSFREFYHFAIKRMERLHCGNCVKVYGHRIFCDSKICRVFDPDNLISFYDYSFHFNSYGQRCLTRLYRDTFLELIADKSFDKIRVV
uniref:SGNH domain-containing protein n=1 Tax=Syphacia muris TaxID=451379 RepID=A0A0N5AC85_9BILA